MTAPSPSPVPHRPPGWYPDELGVTRFWDGNRWTEHTMPPPIHQPHPGFAPMVQPNVKQGRDRSQYVRQQKGHSIIKHLLLGWLLLWIPTIYYAVSPNHYFHA